MVESLEARILEEILYVKFKRLMGLKSEKVSREDLLGIRDMKESLVSLSRRPEEKKWVIASVTTLLTMCQHLVRKTLENPSGPRELLLLRWKTANLISSWEGTTTMNQFCTSETIGPAERKRPSSGMTESA